MSEPAEAGLEIVRSGALTTVQDAGRPGLAHLGVPRSGALDRAAMANANRLVGNPGGAAVLETTLTGVAMQVLRPCAVAVTGALAPVTVDGRPMPRATRLALGAGSVLDVGSAVEGLRSYIALSGGIDVPPVLGSRSTDLLSGLGPPVVRDGDLVPVGTAAPGVGDIDLVPCPPPADLLVLTIDLGPRDDWFTTGALAALVGQPFRVTSVSNRIALRLDGPRLERSVTHELPSEGVVLGAVQVPADGQPLIFLADHPTTGGYPVVAVVADGDVDRCAQARPGSELRFCLT
ncbi:MAG TPA: biotin-dependent carboxyltransferase family protein [Acidimicrobiales bacterium]